MAQIVSDAVSASGKIGLAGQIADEKQAGTDFVSIQKAQQINARKGQFINPNFPLGGTSCLFVCWRCLFGHFGRLLRANRTTIGLSQPTKLSQKSIRHHRKP